MWPQAIVSTVQNLLLHLIRPCDVVLYECAVAATVSRLQVSTEFSSTVRTLVVCGTVL